MEHKESIAIETITPDIAFKILEGNTDNRQQTQKHVRFLAKQMEDGKWKFSGDPIRISDKGRLLDGQHRLMAVVKCGMSFDFLVIRGLSEGVFDVVDTGKARGASDVLSIDKFENAGAYAAVVTRILSYRPGAIGGIISGGVAGHQSIIKEGAKKISNADILEYARQNDLREHIAFGGRAYATLRIFTKTDYAFLHWIFTAISEEDRDIFFDKLVSGTNLSKTDPVLLLRNKLIDNMASNLKFSSAMKTAITFRAWNYFRAKAEVKVLQYSSEQGMPIPK